MAQVHARGKAGRLNSSDESLGERPGLGQSIVSLGDAVGGVQVSPES